MKAKRAIILVSFLILLSSTISFGLTKELLWSALTFSDTSETNEVARNMGINNPSLLEEVMFIKDIDMDNVIGRESAFLLLQYCSIHQIISKEKFFMVAFNLLSQIDTLVFPDRVNEERKKFTVLLSNFEWENKEGNLQVLLSMFDNLLAFLESMVKSGVIANRGLGHSLRERIEEAKVIIQKKRAKGVKAAIHEIREAMEKANPRENKRGDKDDDDDAYSRWCKKRPKGNHINPEACGVFLGFCNNLIWQINHTNF